MRLAGLRAQLCLWHAGLMALTLLVLAGFTYALLSGLLHSRADGALHEAADAQARQIAILLARAETRGAEPPLFLANDMRNWGRYLQVIDPRGTIREKSDGLQTHHLPVSTTALRDGKLGRVTFETVRTLGEHPVRIVTVPVRLGGRVPYLVQAGTSLEGVEAALQRAGWILLILTPSVFAISLIGGWLLVGRALRRVDLLTRAALDIQSTNLQQRLSRGGPDDEIGRLAQAFDQMISRLDESFQQVRRFSADASHELRTPLTALRGEAELALMGDLSPEDARKALRSILESAERMSEVVESLLLLSRADAGQQAIRREPVDLTQLVLETAEKLEGLAARGGICLQVDAPLADAGDEEPEGAHQEPVLLGDELWLGQAVTNLVANAIKYTPEGGSVTVRFAVLPGVSLEHGDRQGATALIEVRDTGIGIAAEHIPHIFDRFYRVDGGRARAAGGTGLGLSITRWAIEAHGGRIEVASTPGEGSTFRVLLPLAGNGEDRPAVPPPLRPVSGVSAR